MPANSFPVFGSNRRFAGVAWKPWPGLAMAMAGEPWPGVAKGEANGVLPSGANGVGVAPSIGV